MARKKRGFLPSLGRDFYKNLAPVLLDVFIAMTPVVAQDAKEMVDDTVDRITQQAINAIEHEELEDEKFEDMLELFGVAAVVAARPPDIFELPDEETEDINEEEQHQEDPPEDYSEEGVAQTPEAQSVSSDAAPGEQASTQFPDLKTNPSSAPSQSGENPAFQGEASPAFPPQRAPQAGAETLQGNAVPDDTSPEGLDTPSDTDEAADISEDDEIALDDEAAQPTRGTPIQRPGNTEVTKPAKSDILLQEGDADTTQGEKTEREPFEPFSDQNINDTTGDILSDDAQNPTQDDTNGSETEPSTVDSEQKPEIQQRSGATQTINQIRFRQQIRDIDNQIKKLELERAEEMKKKKEKEKEISADKKALKKAERTLRLMKMLYWLCWILTLIGIGELFLPAIQKSKHALKNTIKALKEKMKKPMEEIEEIDQSLTRINTNIKNLAYKQNKLKNQSLLTTKPQTT